MSVPIEAFGGDAVMEVLFATTNGRQAIVIKRDLWFDRADTHRWLVWAQERSRDSEALPTENTALGAILVTHPQVMAFLDQLGALLVDPGAFQHDLKVATPESPAYECDDPNVS